MIWSILNHVEKTKILDESVAIFDASRLPEKEFLYTDCTDYIDKKAKISVYLRNQCTKSIKSDFSDKLLEPPSPTNPNPTHSRRALVH